MSAMFPDDMIRDDDGKTTYTPFIGRHGNVGYCCEHDDGRVSFFYLNPSTGSDDGVATIFVYQDEDQSFIQTHHFYDVWEEVT